MDTPKPDKPHHPRKQRRKFSLRQRDTRAPATAPGSGSFVGERRVDEVTLRVIDYSRDTLRETTAATGGQCLEFEREDTPAWISVTGLHEPARIAELLEAYHIHPLVLDDILNTNQPPKVDDFGDYLFITSKLLCRNPAGGERFDLQHFAILLTGRVLMTFQEAPTRAFDPVLSRLREGKGRLRNRGADYLTWALLDAMLDHYLGALDDMEDSVSGLDERLMLPDGDVTLQEIHEVRAQTHFLYRIVRPMREVVVAMQHSESELLTPAVHPFLRDLYDHAWHAIETADHLRETVAGIREYHSAVMNQRMNEVMKVLAAISTVFLPLSFVAGVYGMNLDMPETHLRWAYPAVWIGFFVIGGGMLYYFKRKRWL